MSTQLKITTEYKAGGWLISSEVVTDDEDFPSEVFLWTLDTSGALDKFQAIGQIDQVTKYPSYDSNRKSNFGVHLVKYNNSVQTVLSEEEVTKVIIVLKDAFSGLLTGYNIVKEPVIEYYP